MTDQPRYIQSTSGPGWSPKPLTIVEFLTARLDEEDWGTSGAPARFVADIAAKRAIVGLHQPDRGADTWYWLERQCRQCGHQWHDNTPPGTPPTVIGPEMGCPTLRLLASVYAYHPDYRQEWKP